MTDPSTAPADTNVVRAQLDALEAQVRLTLVQCQALRHALTVAQLTTPAPPAAAEETRPERCAQVDESLCGRQDEDARMSRATFGDPLAWVCRGCRQSFSGAIET
jgi:hypothetical protein